MIVDGKKIYNALSLNKRLVQSQDEKEKRAAEKYVVMCRVHLILTADNYYVSRAFSDSRAPIQGPVKTKAIDDCVYYICTFLCTCKLVKRASDFTYFA
jgi:hypothetical protein